MAWMSSSAHGWTVCLGNWFRGTQVLQKRVGLTRKKQGGTIAGKSQTGALMATQSGVGKEGRGKGNWLEREQEYGKTCRHNLRQQSSNVPIGSLGRYIDSRSFLDYLAFDSRPFTGFSFTVWDFGELRTLEDEKLPYCRTHISRSHFEVQGKERAQVKFSKLVWEGRHAMQGSSAVPSL